MDKMVNIDFYKGKKVLVTGNTGFKGSWLCRTLLLAGADVYGYALEPDTKPNLYEILGLNSLVKTEFGDIRDFEKLSDFVKKIKPQIVFHLAAQPLVRESYANPRYTYETNVMGTVNILEACREVESIESIVNVTTDKVYENKEWEWGYRENENLCGYDPYSNSKSCSELVTYSYKNSFYNSESSPALSTGRSGNVIGGGDFSADRIIPDCVRATVEEKTIIVRNPYSTRPYQHVLDCLNGYLTLAAEQVIERKKEGNYNFGPDESDCVSTGDLADKFCSRWKGAKWENRYDGGPHEANFLKLDCSKAKKILGWKPVWNIDTALNKTVEWYRFWNEKKDLKEITDRQIKEFLKDATR